MNSGVRRDRGLIEDGIVSAVGRALPADNVDRVYDTTGTLVLPSGVDADTRHPKARLRGERGQIRYCHNDPDLR